MAELVMPDDKVISGVELVATREGFYPSLQLHEPTCHTPKNPGTTPETRCCLWVRRLCHHLKTDDYHEAVRNARKLALRCGVPFSPKKIGGWSS